MAIPSEKAVAWGHDALASDLAAHLAGNTRERMIWEDMQLGPSGSMRPDVYTIECSYSRFVATAYEVKVTRSDFLSDVTSGKALRYLQVAGRLIYAVPAGLVTLAEIPEGCGLIVRNPGGGWRHVRKPKVSPVENLPRDVWMKLLIDGCERVRKSAGKDPQARRADTWTHSNRVRKMFGNEIGDLVRDRDYAASRLQQAIAKLDEERKKTTQEIDKLVGERQVAERAELAEIRRQIDEAAAGLGLAPGSSSWDVARQLKALRPENDVVMLDNAARMLEHHGRWMTEQAQAMRKAITTVDTSQVTA